MLEFLLLFEHLSLFLLLKDKKKEMMEKVDITITKAVILFEYEKASKKYYDKPKHYQQVVKGALFIVKVFYASYLLMCLFDNAKYCLVYV